MNMAQIAKGFGVDGEIAESPEQLKSALVRARKATVEGRPYLIDAQVGARGRRLGGQAVDSADQHRAGAHQESLERNAAMPKTD